MDVRFSLQRWDAFGGSPSESSAYKYGTQGVAIYSLKPDASSQNTSDRPHPDAVLDAPGANCATLTPLIKAHIRELASGQILEVRTDDAAAREGVPAWSRLTGNALVASDDAADPGGTLRFYLRKK